uniref:Uncharacterized protein n=1 Tax=Lactuca sativa TaxID=4236 RepID=A0A9R1UVC8_LACSA|nr:hypothetical protein LSAT_V11C800423940 [Lactuca sativa]
MRTYEEVVYPLPEHGDWEVPNDLMVVNPPIMEIRQARRLKHTNYIPSQGEEPKIRRYSRCHSTTHNARTCKEIVLKKQNKSRKRSRASGSGTKAREDEGTQATENQWKQEAKIQGTHETENLGT